MESRIAVGLSFITILAAPFAFGQTSTPELGRVNIPFKFMVAKKELPAGKYQMLRQEGKEDRLQLRNVQSGTSTFIPIIERLAETDPAQKHGARVVFDTVGDRKILSEFWPADNSDGYLLSINKGEQQHEVVQQK